MVRCFGSERHCYAPSCAPRHEAKAKNYLNFKSGTSVVARIFPRNNVIHLNGREYGVNVALGIIGRVAGS